MPYLILERVRYSGTAALFRRPNMVQACAYFDVVDPSSGYH